MKSNDYIIDVRNLKKSFDDKVIIEDISLQIKRGEIFGFIGPNGQGKTTTIRMLCGLLTPDAGSGQCLGYDILKQTKEIKYYTGYMPQQFSLYKDLTVYENLKLLAELYGITQREKKIVESMRSVGIEQYRNQTAGTLSVGWQQKLALSSALLHDAFLLLLDEPTASVDPQSRKEIWDLLHSLSNRGITILVSSHNLDEIEHCHRIAYLNKGKIMMRGTIHDVISQAHLTTWSVTGLNLTLLEKQLEITPGIDIVVMLSDSLHVTSKDADALEKAIQPFRENPNFRWKKTKTQFEDIFVWFTK